MLEAMRFIAKINSCRCFRPYQVSKPSFGICMMCEHKTKQHQLIRRPSRAWHQEAPTNRVYDSTNLLESILEIPPLAAVTFPGVISKVAIDLTLSPLIGFMPRLLSPRTWPSCHKWLSVVMFFRSTIHRHACTTIWLLVIIYFRRKMFLVTILVRHKIVYLPFFFR